MISAIKEGIESNNRKASPFKGNTQGDAHESRNTQGDAHESMRNFLGR